MIEAYLVVEQGRHRIIQNVKPSKHGHCVPLILEYLAEGGANVVYRILTISVGACVPIPLGVQGKLLRLRKDKPFTAQTERQIEIFDATFKVLFPQENTLDQSLICMDKSVLIAVNEDLRNLENIRERSDMRIGETVATDDPYGLLMTDMTAIGAEMLLEIKPKWLSQSPNAPSDARRCRTCALRAQRTKAKADGLVVPLAADICPLALVTGNSEAVLKVAEAILRANNIGFDPITVSSLADLIANTAADLLQTLRQHQTKLDKDGILSLAQDRPPPTDLQAAMTLRDCTLLIRAKDGVFDSSTEIRLADLDLKQPTEAKVKKWRQTERSLIDEGWYSNTEPDKTIEAICLLSRPNTG